MAIPTARLTLPDRLVNWLDPVAGQRRLAARTLQASLGGYGGASTTARSLATWWTLARSADRDQAPDLERLRARSRDLARNNPLAGGALHTITTRTVGTGLALQPQPDRRVLGWDEARADDWRATLEAEWRMWAESTACDIGGRLNFYGLQDLVFRSALESGDAFTLLPMVPRASGPYRLALQVLEADRVGNPGVETDTEYRVQGVELDETTGAARRYHIYDRHPGGMTIADLRAGRWVDARTRRGTPAVLHHYRILRPGQTRGVPHLAPVIEALQQLGRYTQAEIMGAVVSGMFTVFVKSDAPESSPLLQATDTSGAPADGDSVRLDSGAIVGLAPGEDVSIANPGRPNAAFDGFVASILRQIAVGLEIPFEVLVKHFTASYSASRAALLDAYIFFRSRRAWLAQSLCQPVYEAWLDEAVALGRIAAPGYWRDPLLRAAYRRAAWTGDSPGALDPVKEVQGWTTAIDARLATREQAAMELYGSDWSAVLEQSSRESRRMREEGVEPAAPAQAVPGAPQPERDDDDDTERPGVPPRPQEG